ncbi:hypothetical protein X943_001707 [Babesia divergens]|uniref:Uncharacterized protein n=1 Tax=Babesia divergens TaxID=32595 RepID=A0AAD9LJZ0_BABDI|nr:hypothetical protein X943_001707 [Babesia divergens]
MKVSRTLFTVALCLFSLGHSGRGVLGDNSVGRRLSTQEDVSAGMLGGSDQGEPVSLGFFGSVGYAFKEFYNDSKVALLWAVLITPTTGLAAELSLVSEPLVLYYS